MLQGTYPSCSVTSLIVITSLLENILIYSFSVSMGLHPILAVLALILVATQASLLPETYWNSVLRNTPMPKSVSELLHPSEFMEEKGTSVQVGKGGVNVNTGKPKPGGTSVNVGKGGVNVNTGKGKQSGGGTTVNVGGNGKGGVSVHAPGKGTNVGVGKGGVSVQAPGKGTTVGVGKGGVSVHAPGKKGKPVYVGVHPGPNPFNYIYAATETQLHDDPNVALFFLEKDLQQPGKTMNLHFTKNAGTSSFLPRQVANSIPFSSNNLPQIYSEFSVKPESLEAEMMKTTIKECEAPGIKGEERYCATSLESMIDFSTSKLGKNVQAISTEVEKQTPKQKYRIMGGGVKKMGSGEKSVVCHKQNYAYAVFYCHATKATRAYTVSMEGADRTMAKAVAVCHTDTAAWNPKHLAFQVLKVKPGTVPVCHFLPQDHIVWVSSN